MRTENVVSVMCNGKWIMKEKKIVNVDEVLCTANHFVYQSSLSPMTDGVLCYAYDCKLL